MGSDNSIQQNNLRFCSHPDFSTNQVITHRIQVKGQYLYFQPKNQHHKFQHIAQQYQTYTGKPLVLQNLQIKIPKQLTIGVVDKNENLQKALQEIIDRLQDKDTYHKVTKDEVENNIFYIQNQENPSVLIDKIVKETKNNVKSQSQRQIQLRINDRGNILIVPYNLDQNQNYFQLLDSIINFVFTMKLKEKKKIKSKPGHQQNELINPTYQDKNEQQRTQFFYGRRSSQIYDEKRNLIKPQDHSGNIKGYIKDQLTLLLHGGDCYFSQNSTLTIYQKGKFVYITLSSVKQQNGVQVGTFNSRVRRIQYSAQFKLKKEKGNGKNFYKIFLQSLTNKYRRQILIQKQQLVLNEQLDWIRAQLLTLGTNIYGVNENLQETPILFKIIQIQKNDIQSNIDVFSISSHKFLNIVIDGIIVHNENNIEIICKQIQQKILQTKTMKIDRNQTFQKHFKNKRCYYGGHMVQGHQSFGDYHLQNNDIIYVLKEKKQNLFEVSRFHENTISIHTYENDRTQNINKDNLRQLLDQYRSDYYGLWRDKLISFTNQEIDRLQLIGNIHIICVRKGFAKNINFSTNILPRFYTQQLILAKKQYRDVLDHFYQIYQQYQLDLKTNLLKNVILTQEQAFPIYLYTTNVLYQELNKFLREQLEKENIQNLRKYIPQINQITRSLQLLPNYEGICYRGIQNAKISKLFGVDEKNQTICFDSFTSTSVSQSRGIKFSNSQGIVLKIISRTGKYITKLSKFSYQQQVLFPPFTNFLILKDQDYNQQSKPQRMTIQEIPISKSQQANLLFWVDDQPHNNQWIANQFRADGIQVLEITSTKMMKVIIKGFFKVYKMLGKKMVIITDMVRFQGRNENFYAGLDLLKILYHQYALTIKTFLYTSPHRLQDNKALIQRQSYSNPNIGVVGDKHQLIQQIKLNFGLL